MAYATIEDISKRIGRVIDDNEAVKCENLLEDAAVIIDAFNEDATIEAKHTVSCRMVMRSLGDGDIGVPMGATQGSMSGLGYAQSWTMSSGSAGELYLSKMEKQILGVGNKIGSYSPVQDL